MAARAASNAPATALTCAAVSAACDAAALNHPAYGRAAAIIAADALPRHPWPARSDVTDANESAAEPNSAASPSHAAAAASVGPEPAPENIRSELISGGNTEKFIAPPSQD
ncbi:hypothetical protein MCNS_35180 [Mycobacterium conspicuum]|uniref:Uncharacterized protein n=1 Tax=Mycobacterium conspicuum TaxID=44010 RepID=A0A7I7YFA1_9MYCO|nr:hypothetical protein MCNS_35180 [Mycobacterium conspicuum]